MALILILCVNTCSVSGATVFAKDGATESNFTGIAYDKDSSTWQFIRSGRWDRSYTGIAKSSYDDKNYFVRNGVVDFAFTGIARNYDESTWDYVKRGKADLNYTGIAKSIYDGENYFVRKGKVDFTFTGLAYNPETKTWDYCLRGRARYNFHGAAKSIYDGEYYYAKNGKVDFTFTGLAYSQDHNTYIYTKNGKHRSGYTGPSTSMSTAKYYHVVKGLWSRPESGEYKAKTNQYTYTRGRIVSSVVNYDNKLLYIDGDSLPKGSGIVKTNLGQYYYVDPATGLANQKAGFIDYKGKKYYAREGGALMHDGIFQVDGKWYGATADASLAQNGWVKAGKLYYNFNDYEVEDTCIRAKSVMDQNSYDLRTMFFWSATEIPYFSFQYNKNWGSKWFADYGFVKERGNCYVIAATFYYFAKMLGYDAHQVSGTVYLDHSWVEIDEDGETYVYDPEVYTEAKIVRYRLQYGHYQLRNYHDYSRMN